MKSVYVTIPLHDGKIFKDCVAGMMQMQLYFRDRCAFDTQTGSFLPKNRDELTVRFLQSQASHMLCLDSDIGFKPEDVDILLERNVDFVSGIYCKKDNSGQVPARLNGIIKDGLLGAEKVPGGFLLLSRKCIEDMFAAYSNLEYTTQSGRTFAVWATTFEPGERYCGEDAAFCSRYLKIGGQIWIDPSVIVRHYGDRCYLPVPKDGLLQFSN